MLRLAFFSLTVTLCAVACRAPEASPNAKRYDVKGKVVAVNKAERRVTIAHEEIGDYMTAMTMPFAVKKKDDWALNVLAPGDEVTATLVVDDSLSWIENIVIAKEGSRDAGEASKQTSLRKHDRAMCSRIFLSRIRTASASTSRSIAGACCF